jgi:hypothetical protein
MGLVHRNVTRGVLLATGLRLAPGCADEPAQAPHMMHPIPQDRARELIAQTFRQAGVAPEVDRFVHVGRDEKRVRLEVAAAGHKFGVAYLTAEDWEQAGDALPPHSKTDSLVVATGEGGTKILCLFASDYGEDDQTGDERRATTIAADRRLERDVRDFLHRAEEQSWK